ncbi:TetR/AcrR family transcriptional regulator [Streptomyces sp. NPDC088732]|uniref:TetR/AcrR family transcriptional regulator n=1 Tax=Streptomyces sp. NPDC088732 TaxID=3365879 RepID=UPI00380C9D9C
MYVKGVAATTLDDIRTASGTSKSQLYRHYPDKDALARDVIALQATSVLERQHQLPQRLNSLWGRPNALPSGRAEAARGERA